MKKSQTVILISIGIIMLLITIISLTEIRLLLFTEETAEYLTAITSINQYYAIFFIVSYFSILFFQYNRPSSIKLILLTISGIMWLFSGRTIAVKSFPDGRIKTGWYCVPTHTFCLCEPEEDCETSLYNDCEIMETSLGYLIIKKDNIEHKILIGPFLLEEARAMVQHQTHAKYIEN